MELCVCTKIALTFSLTNFISLAAPSDIHNCTFPGVVVRSCMWSGFACGMKGFMFLSRTVYVYHHLPAVRLHHPSARHVWP